MANNIDKWHEKNIVGVGFENDDDFENLKISPIDFTVKEEDNHLSLLRAGTFKIFTGHRPWKWNGGGD